MMINIDTKTASKLGKVLDAVFMIEIVKPCTPIVTRVMRLFKASLRQIMERVPTSRPSQIRHKRMERRTSTTYPPSCLDSIKRIWATLKGWLPGSVERFVTAIPGENGWYGILANGRSMNTAAINRLANNIGRFILEESAFVEDKVERAELAKWALSSESRTRIDAMIYLAQAMVPILPERMDKDPWLLNCQNGTLDLRTGRLRAHIKNDYITQLCPIDYLPDSPCPLWESTIDFFLGSDDELIGYWQRLIGYTLTGVVRDHSCRSPMAPGRTVSPRSWRCLPLSSVRIMR